MWAYQTWTRETLVRIRGAFGGFTVPQSALGFTLVLSAFDPVVSMRPLEADFGQGMGPVEREHLAFVLLGVAIVPFGAVQNNTLVPEKKPSI